MFTKRALFWLVFLILASYFFCIIFEWYLSYPWLDIPFHFLGGLAAALFFAVYFGKSLENRSLIFIILFLAGTTLMVGVFWEFFEWGLDHTLYRGSAFLNQPSLDDTLLDLLMDLAGGLFLSFLFLRSRGRIRI